MNMKNLVLGVAVMLGACADSGDSGFGDSLPKRGDRSSDPTIVSAIADCDVYSSYSSLSIEILASDPSGELGPCSGTVGGIFQQETFGDDNSCWLHFRMPCSTMQEATFELMVANDHAGLTEATITIPVIQH